MVDIFKGIGVINVIYIHLRELYVLAGEISDRSFIGKHFLFVYSLMLLMVRLISYDYSAKAKYRLFPWLYFINIFQINTVSPAGLPSSLTAL